MKTWAWLLLALPQDDPARLVDALRTGDVEQRETAMRRLKELGERALPELRKAAEDPDQEVAGRARFLVRRAEVAARLPEGLKLAAPGIEDRLAGSENAWTLVWMDLTRREEAAVAPALLEPLAAAGVRGARTEEEKVWACQTAASQDYKSAAPAIVQLLQDPSDSVKSAAMQALVGLRAPEAVPLLVRMVREGSEDGRLQAEQLIMVIGGSVPAAVLAELVKSDAPRVRAAGLRALANLGKENEDAVALVLPALADAVPAVRLAALNVLPAVATADHAARVLPLLKDAEANVRQAALQALVQLGARAQAAAVRPLLADPVSTVRYGALEAVAAFGLTDAAEAVVALLKDEDDEVRHQAAQTLVVLDAVGCRDAILPLLKDASPSTRLLAIWALGHLRAAGAAAELEGFLAHEEPAFRASAAAALGRSGATASAPALLRLLDDKHMLVRLCAVEALGALRAEAARQPLLALVSEAHAAVRGAAARALAELGATEAAPLLQDLLADETDADEDEEDAIDGLERFSDAPECLERYGILRGPVQAAAAEALCRLGFREGIGGLVAAADDDYETVDLVWLNPFRRPAEVEKLKAATLAADLTGTAAERFRAIAAALGLEFKRNEDQEDVENLRVLPPLKADGRRTLWDALCATAEASEFEVVVDRRRLRMLEDVVASEFWNLWWEAEKED